MSQKTNLAILKQIRSRKSQVLKNEFYMNHHLEKAKSSFEYDNADVAFLCCLAKMNELRSKTL